MAVAAETLLPLTELLAGFRAAHPGVTLRCFQSTPEVMQDQLRAREVDFCFASQPLSGPALGAVRLLREEVLLVVPTGHPLAGRGRVTVAEIAGEPFITTRAGHWQRALLERLFGETGRRPVISCEGDEPGATHFLIAAGLGIGLMPSLARADLSRMPLAWLHLDTFDCVRTLSLVRREDRYLSTATARFRDMAVAHFSTRGPGVGGVAA